MLEYSHLLNIHGLLTCPHQNFCTMLTAFASDLLHLSFIQHRSKLSNWDLESRPNIVSRNKYDNPTMCTVQTSSCIAITSLQQPQNWALKNKMPSKIEHIWFMCCKKKGFQQDSVWETSETQLSWEDIPYLWIRKKKTYEFLLKFYMVHRTTKKKCWK